VQEQELHIHLVPCWRNIPMAN